MDARNNIEEIEVLEEAPAVENGKTQSTKIIGLRDVLGINCAVGFFKKCKAGWFSYWDKTLDKWLFALYKKHRHLLPKEEVELLRTYIPKDWLEDYELTEELNTIWEKNDRAIEEEVESIAKEISSAAKKFQFFVNHDFSRKFNKREIDEICDVFKRRNYDVEAYAVGKKHSHEGVHINWKNKDVEDDDYCKNWPSAHLTATTSYETFKMLERYVFDENEFYEDAVEKIPFEKYVSALLNDLNDLDELQKHSLANNFLYNGKQTHDN